jgi:hypothetical protein
MNFIKFTNELKNKENTSLIEAIQSGYKALHESESPEYMNLISDYNANINSLDEGVVDFMKKTAMGAALALMMAQGAFAHQLTPSLIDDHSTHLAQMAVKDLKQGETYDDVVSKFGEVLRHLKQSGHIDDQDKTSITKQLKKKIQVMTNPSSNDMTNQSSDDITDDNKGNANGEWKVVSTGGDRDRDVGSKTYESMALTEYDAIATVKMKIRADHVNPQTMNIEVEQDGKEWKAIAVPK